MAKAPKDSGAAVLGQFRIIFFLNDLKEDEEMVDAAGNDGNGSMREQVKRPNLWRKIMMMMTWITLGIFGVNTFL